MRSAVAAAMMAFGLHAATIVVQTSPVGVNGSGETVYRSVLDLTNAPLALNQELNIRFPAATYQSLFNGVAPADFDLLLFQPNNPLGTEGAYSLLSLVNQPSMTGVFRVDFTLVGGQTPGGLAFTVNQFDANGVFQNTVPSGLTEAPEPGTWVLGLFGMFFAGLNKASQRRR